ncbi:MAG: hypothetical protein BGO98_11335 [Myxococcales bacterium 68-20]|nr:MAG: hypothetical protein BGO98_11335 [Myxococcales bacterium 68-20]
MDLSTDWARSVRRTCLHADESSSKAMAGAAVCGPGAPVCAVVGGIAGGIIGSLAAEAAAECGHHRIQG